MIIGITGSFGSGKTTVANMFSKYGFKVINVDKLYRGIYNKNNSLKNKIKKEFGTINRSEIKKIVFNDYNKLKKLNKITHPIIISEIKKEIGII
ncbi:MAG: dephospho-CoA kinase, partial [Nanoarchaeota archaeon]|nr:dephospho-CoA kinase [Nanoarchaeota archaeon]